jgi:hypothetical protein
VNIIEERLYGWDASKERDTTHEVHAWLDELGIDYQRDVGGLRLLTIDGFRWVLNSDWLLLTDTGIRVETGPEHRARVATTR